MAQVSADPPPPSKSSDLGSKIFSYIFDIRFLGVLGQIGFIFLLLFGAATLFSNFGKNIDKLGEAQFRCRDGRVSYRCAYDFMDTEAGFDISDTPLDYSTSDSFWWALASGLVNTFRVGFLSLIAMTILGTLMGIARMSDNWLISRLSLAYIEVIRNTPILVQLLLIYFSIVLALPDIKEALQPFGLPIFLSNRGFRMPWPLFMSSAPIWIAFLILGAIQFQVVWMFLGRREEQTGKSQNRIGWGVAGFVIIAAIGWFVASGVANNEGLLVATKSRVKEFGDFEQIMLQRAGVNHISEVAALPEDAQADLAFQFCAMRESSSEPNLTNRLRSQGIPFEVARFSSPTKATASFVEGGCEFYIGEQSTLSAQLTTLENPSANLILPLKEQPLVWSIPRFEGFNVVGGWSMTGEFFALFLGLTIFYAGGLAEVVRAGILSVSKGQSEASRALGLNNGQRLSLIVMPQALKVIIPPLISTYLSLMKDTSLGVAVAFPEIYIVSQTLMNQSGRVLQIMIVLMAVYLSISLLFSVVLNWYNDRILIVER
ncbi:MAG: general L-amino acid transport system permease protein [Cellvibrionaceae bacterium]|jgi:general L-amino acid transport system permease protein